MAWIDKLIKPATLHLTLKFPSFPRVRTLRVEHLFASAAPRGFHRIILSFIYNNYIQAMMAVWCRLPATFAHPLIVIVHYLLNLYIHIYMELCPLLTL